AAGAPPRNGVAAATSRAAGARRTRRARPRCPPGPAAAARSHPERYDEPLTGAARARDAPGPPLPVPAPIGWTVPAAGPTSAPCPATVNDHVGGPGAARPAPLPPPGGDIPWSTA